MEAFVLGYMNPQLALGGPHLSLPHIQVVDSIKMVGNTKNEKSWKCRGLNKAHIIFTGKSDRLLNPFVHAHAG